MSTARKWTDLDELLLAMSDIVVLEQRRIGVNEVGYDGDRPLHLAARWGDVEAIDTLVTAGAEVDAPGEFNFTALRHAVAFGNVAAARRLLELGASPAASGDWGGTPKEVADRYGCPK